MHKDRLKLSKHLEYVVACDNTEFVEGKLSKSHNISIVPEYIERDQEQRSG